MSLLRSLIPHLKPKYVTKSSVKTTCIYHADFSSDTGTAADPSDVELSYTIYPDSETSVDATKKPVIFLHGLFGAKGNLRGVSKHLSNNGRKIITYDARNHGESQHTKDMTYDSMAEDLSGLIDDLKLNQPVVMGHSMGGKTAMTFALKQPEKLSALIVADVSPNKSPGVGSLKEYAKAMKKINIPEGVQLHEIRKQAQSQLSSVVTNRGILQFLLTNLKEGEDGRVKWRVNFDAFLNNYDEIAGFQIENVAPFQKPTLFVYGENSDHYKSRSTEKIKTLFPNSEISAIKDAGHFLHADKPLEFVQVVEKFLQKINI